MLGSRVFLWALPGLVLSVLLPPSLRVPGVLALNALAILTFWIDARRLLRSPLEISREPPPRLWVDGDFGIGIGLTNRSLITLKASVRDEIPAGTSTSTPILEARLAPDLPVTLSYPLSAQVRGKTHFGDLHARIESTLGLAAVDLTVAARCDVRIMPASFAQRAKQRASLQDDLGQVRARLLRAPQSGGELESLREYVAGDALRAIDWNATARRGHPITRVFQPERSQTLWLVLDASRTMATLLREDDGKGRGARSRFDLALEVALDLAHRALGVGDQVGAIVYAERRLIRINPGRGRAHERVLLDALSVAMPDFVQLDVRGLVAELERSAKKRSLIVLFTDLENESHGQLLSDHAPRLQRKHLTMLVSLDDAVTQTLANAPPDNEETAYLQAAAVDQLKERDSLRARLVTRGLTVLEASETRLFPAALDKYLALKTAQRL